jgi:hypothetical protein
MNDVDQADLTIANHYFLLNVCLSLWHIYIYVLTSDTSFQIILSHPSFQYVQYEFQDVAPGIYVTGLIFISKKVAVSKEPF